MVGVCETQLWERFVLMISDPLLWPVGPSYTKVDSWSMHKFTIIQVLFWATTWAFNLLIPFATTFWVISLIPLRLWLLPLIFTETDLHNLDNDDEEVAMKLDMEDQQPERNSRRLSSKSATSATDVPLTKRRGSVFYVRP